MTSEYAGSKWPVIFGLFIGMSSMAVAARAQQSAPDTVPATTVVTVEARHGKDVPSINREDVRVFEGHNRLQVTDWVSLQGDQAALELFVLVDEASNTDVAAQFDDVRRFMNAQQSTTSIAVGYIQNGSARITQNFTTDHAQAGKALRVPIASAAGASSPYLSITDAIKHWPATSARRAILMVSDGIDPLQPGPMDTYLSAASEEAQRAGIQVSAIYASRGGHFGHTLWRITQGQSNLSQLSDETGGEAYFEGLDTPVAFAPFLNQFADRLNHQYRLSFLAKAEKKASLQSVRLETEVPDAELVTAGRVSVPAAQ